MTTARRRSRDGAGEPDGRDGFPCWIGCDAHGVRAYAWESVRLVEWIDGQAVTAPGHIDLKPAASIAIAHSDGTDREVGFIGLCQHADDFANTVYEAVRTHRFMAKELGKVPSC